jgi:hypothetical protein
VRVELHEKRKAEISVIEAHARSTVMMRLGDKTKAKIQQNLVVAAELDQQVLRTCWRGGEGGGEVK